MPSPLSLPTDRLLPSTTITFLPRPPPKTSPSLLPSKPTRSGTPVSASSKIVRCPPLDKHVEKSNKIRFVQKLKTLLLSKPKHFLPLHILSKCRSYLSLTDSRSLLSMIHRYPSIFELFTIPTPPSPFNATRPYYQVCVRLTPAAAALALEEAALSKEISLKLAHRLQKLLMLASHRRLILSKLVHLAPDMGFPADFRTRLCNDFPEKFRTVDTSYGRALELVEWDDELGVALPRPKLSRELIVDRPLKFNHVRLRNGLNVKRIHQDFLVKFRDLPDVCPYSTCLEEFDPHSLEAEKRACAVVREILGMTVEKRTLIDHLTHFRKEFGLPNKLRGMIVRHPELFYVSLKGLRDSVFLVEAFDEKGKLLEKDETSVIKEKLMVLVRKAKRMRRERRQRGKYGNVAKHSDDVGILDNTDDDYDDGLNNLFESEDADFEFEFDDEIEEGGETTEFWTVDPSFIGTSEGGESKEPW